LGEITISQVQLNGKYESMGLITWVGCVV